MMFNFNYLDTIQSQLEALIIDNGEALSESSSQVMRLCGHLSHCAHFRIVFHEFNALIH